MNGRTISSFGQLFGSIGISSARVRILGDVLLDDFRTAEVTSEHQPAMDIAISDQATSEILRADQYVFEIVLDDQAAFTIEMSDLTAV